MMYLKKKLFCNTNSVERLKQVKSYKSRILEL